MEKDTIYAFVFTLKGDVVGTKSWFYDSEKEAALSAKSAMSTYKADEVSIHRFDEGTGEFLKNSVVRQRNDIKWKEVYNAQNMFGKAFHYCQEVAENVGYKYLLFNGVVYSVNGTLNQGLCEEKDLIV